MIKKALNIAVSELRECYDEQGIVAGKHHFTDYWGRDGFFASFGALKLNDKGTVKKMLELFFKNQREDGLIPYRIMNGPVTLSKYIGKPKRFPTPRPTYKLRGLFQDVYDGTTLCLILLCESSRKEGIKKYQGKILKALGYLQKREKDGLLWDGVMAEWNDTAYKYGNLLYSNILYWYVLKRISELMPDKSFADKEKEIAANIKYKLWNGSYFSDWHDYKRQDYFYPYGNFLAIYFGFTTKEETKSILDYAEKARVLFTFETNMPKYPFWRIDILHHLSGNGNYQNKSTLWFQPVLSYILALAKSGKKKEAIRHLETVSEQIIKHNGIYECYDRKGNPLKKIFYKSEHPFAWSSGMFIWAASECGIRNLKNKY